MKLLKQQLPSCITNNITPSTAVTENKGPIFPPNPYSLETRYYYIVVRCYWYLFYCNCAKLNLKKNETVNEFRIYNTIGNS